MTSLDEFLAFMPKEKKETENKNSGLCLRYSPTHKKWVIAYGVARSKSAKRWATESPSAGYGNTPIEACLNMVEKIKNWERNHG